MNTFAALKTCLCVCGIEKTSVWRLHWHCEVLSIHSGNKIKMGNCPSVEVTHKMGDEVFPSLSQLHGGKRDTASHLPLFLFPALPL